MATAKGKKETESKELKKDAVQEELQGEGTEGAIDGQDMAASNDLTGEAAAELIQEAA